MKGDLIKWLSYIFVITSLSVIETKSKTIALISTIFKFLYFLYRGNLAKTTSNSLFSKVKRYSIYIPVIFYSLSLFFPSKIYEHIFTFILIINLLEAAIIPEIIADKNIRSIINGICIIILALLTPRLTFNKGLLSFSDKYNWGILNTLLLSGVYLFNSDFKGGNVRYSALLSVILPTIISQKFNFYWTPLRAYLLSNVIFIDDIFPEIHNGLVKNINRYIEPSDKKYNKIQLLYTILTTFFTLHNIPKAYKSSYVYSLVK
jgi:hypothetical protein